VLPTVKGSPASAAVIAVTGITGRIRGMKFKRPDGKSVRPDLIIPDDPQTRESAKSPSQCDEREKILCGDVLGLAGPTTKISVLMPMTVIQPGDLADRMLDREKHPEWQGERTKLIYEWPEAWETLWQQYRKVRADGMRAGDRGAAARRSTERTARRWTRGRRRLAGAVQPRRKSRRSSTRRTSDSTSGSRRSRPSIRTTRSTRSTPATRR
jgi:hypothetical protein